MCPVGAYGQVDGDRQGLGVLRAPARLLHARPDLASLGCLERQRRGAWVRRGPIERRRHRGNLEQPIVSAQAQEVVRADGQTRQADLARGGQAVVQRAPLLPAVFAEVQRHTQGIAIRVLCFPPDGKPFVKHTGCVRGQKTHLGRGTATVGHAEGPRALVGADRLSLGHFQAQQVPLAVGDRASIP